MKIKLLGLILLSLFAINAQANDCDNKIGNSECAPKENISGKWLTSETYPVREAFDFNGPATYGDTYNSAPTHKSASSNNSAPAYKSYVTTECYHLRGCTSAK